jgi:poly-gamma-glutamate synthesis protein (capsule biosynthesis protein)
MYYTVYLPPCYDANAPTPYPTLYLLHGSASYDDHWLQIGLEEALNSGISDGTFPPMIAVLPYGEWIANENQFERVSFENVFLEELLPAVEARYPVATTRDQRAIGGVSRGGFWAFEIAFRHPELFGSVGGHSAFFDPNHAPDTHNPLDLASTAANLETLRIWLDRGADDYAAPGLDLMDAALRQRGLAYTYTVHPEGEHDNRYWGAHVGEYLAFYAQAFQPVQLSAPTLPDPAAFAFIPPPNAPDPAIFEFVPPPTIVAPSAWEIYLPVVAFNSTRADLDSGALWNLLAGTPDANLIVDSATLSRLEALGISVSAARVVAPAELWRALTANREAFALLPFDQVSSKLRVLRVDGFNPLMRPNDYPLALQSDTPNFYSDRLTTLTLSGVTAITRQSIPAIDANGLEWASSGIAPYTTQVDYFHTSNEVSFTEACPQAEETPLGAFCSKAAHFPILEQVGLDIVELSGNHNNDYGYSAYRDTLARYAAANIATIGGGATPADAQQPLLLTHHNNRVAMIACNDAGPYYALASNERPGAADCNGAWLQAAIAEVRPTVDIVVVSVQHTEFEEYTPRDGIRNDFHQLADWGADVVVGTHAHKPQTFEFYSAAGGTAFIHYGLGNLFFDQPFWGNSRFWMDTLVIYEGRLVTVDLFTGIIDDQARPRPMTLVEQKNFLEFMFVVNNGVEGL